MGLFDIFKKKKDSRDQPGITLAKLIEKVKKEGYSEREIRQQMVKNFGKEQLKSFGEGVTISSLKVDGEKFWERTIKVFWGRGYNFFIKSRRDDRGIKRTKRKGLR